MILLRCPKFPRCLTADAPNFDRGHSFAVLYLPLAAHGSLPTSARRWCNGFLLSLVGADDSVGPHVKRGGAVFVRRGGVLPRPYWEVSPSGAGVVSRFRARDTFGHGPKSVQKGRLNLRFKNPRTLFCIADLRPCTTRSQNIAIIVSHDASTFFLRRCRLPFQR